MGIRSPIIPIKNKQFIVWLLAACMALQMIGYGIIMPIFARRFGDFGAGVRELGISMTVYALAAMIAAPFIGSLADRIGRRPVILFSLLAYVCVFIGYLLATSAGMFIVLRGIAGALTAGLMPAALGMVGDIAPTEKKAQWIGIVASGASVGWILGPVIGGILYDMGGYQAPFLFSAIVASMALVVAFACLPETWAGSQTTSHHRDRKQAGGLLAGRIESLSESLPEAIVSFAMLMFISFVVFFSWAFIEPPLMFYLYDDLNWSSTLFGLASMGFGIALALGELTLGRLSDRFGRKPILLIGLVLFSAQYAGLVFWQSFVMILISFIVAGLGNALIDPSQNAFIFDISDEKARSRVMGIRSSAASFGAVLGPALIVVISPLISPQIAFAIATVIVLVAVVLGVFFLKEPVRGISAD